ncbi:MAG: hypothetical protein ACRCTL_12625 [Pseudomonas sp.]
MRPLGTILLVTISINTYADNQDTQLKCQEVNEGSVKKLELSDREVRFEVSQYKNSCDQIFTYSQTTGNKNLFIIKSWPTIDEFGENAKNDIFTTLLPDKKATLIGSIPVSANYINDYTYKNLSQTGGSIYETIYIIKARSISIQQPSKELMFSGSQCIYSKKHSGTCKEITGTFENPICIYNIGHRKILAPLPDCSGLSTK